MKKFMMMLFAFGMSACALDPAGNPSDQQVPDEASIPANPDYLATAKAQQARAQNLISPDFAACGKVGPNLQDQVISNASQGSGGANIRNGSSTSCPALGVLEPTDDARYFCFTGGNDGFAWTFLRDTRTKVEGWVRDDLLRLGGSIDFCGF